MVQNAAVVAAVPRPGVVEIPAAVQSDSPEPRPEPESTPQARAPQVRAPQIRALQICTCQIRIMQITIPQVHHLSKQECPRASKVTG